MDINTKIVKLNEENNVLHGKLKEYTYRAKMVPMGGGVEGGGGMSHVDYNKW